MTFAKTCCYDNRFKKRHTIFSSIYSHMKSSKYVFIGRNKSRIICKLLSLIINKRKNILNWSRWNQFNKLKWINIMVSKCFTISFLNITFNWFKRYWSTIIIKKLIYSTLESTNWKKKKKCHSNLIDIIRRTIPLFSPGKSLFLYSTNLFFLLL